MTERDPNAGDQAQAPRARVPRQGGSPEDGRPRYGEGAAPGGAAPRGDVPRSVPPHGGGVPGGVPAAGAGPGVGAGSGTSGGTGGRGPARDGLGPARDRLGSDGDGLGLDGAGVDGDGAGTAEEDELRVLLERFVPHLPAPAQRLENVRARLRRRRGRRAAGVATGAVLAVAAAGLLVPGLRTAPGSPDAAGRGAGPASAASAPASVPATAVPGPATAPGNGATTSPQPADGPTGPAMPDYTLVPFGEGDALRLRVPPGWFTMVPPGSSVVYVSSQDLALPPDNCAHPLDGFCTPLARVLAADGVLLAVELRFGPGLTGKYRATRPTVVVEPLLDACRAVGGTKELATVVPEPPGSDVVLTATACLSRPSVPQEERARVLMSTVDLS